MEKVAVIGDKNSVLAFRALGLQVFTPLDSAMIRKTIDRCAREGYGIIYITERFAEMAKETVDRYTEKPTPAIILIPDSKGSLGIGLRNISENVHKAVGMDLFENGGTP